MTSYENDKPELDELAQRIRDAGGRAGQQNEVAEPTLTGASDQAPVDETPPRPDYPAPAPAPSEVVDAEQVSSVGDEPPRHQGLFERHKKACLAVGALVVAAVVGGVVGGVVGTGGGNKKPLASQEQVVDTPPATTQPTPTSSATEQITPTTPEQSPTANNSETVPSQEDLIYPNAISGTAEQPGNLNLANANNIEGASPGQYTYTVTWQGQTLTLPKIYEPGGDINGHAFEIKDTTNEVLANLAALMTLDPNSTAFTQVLNNFTNTAILKNSILKLNRDFQNLRPNDPPYSNQMVIFDTQEDPVTVSFDSNQGIWDVASGSIYARFLSRNCQFVAPGTNTCQISNSPLPPNEAPVWQDPRADVPAQALLLQIFNFSLSFNADGTANVNDFGYNLWNGTQNVQ